MTSDSADTKPASVRIRGEHVGSPLKGWEPLDPTAAKLSWYIKEIILGLVICFTQTPETIAFALTAHIDPSQVRFISSPMRVVAYVFIRSALFMPSSHALVRVFIQHGS